MPELTAQNNLATDPAARLASDEAYARYVIATGDYWGANGEGFTLTVPGTIKDRAGVIEGIRRAFVPVPLLGEVTRRHVKGVVGFEPGIEWVLGRELKQGDVATEPETNDLAAINSAVTNWWDGADAHKELQKFVTRLISERSVELHLYVPQDAFEATDTGQRLPVNTFEEALPLVRFHVCEPGTAAVYKKLGSRREVATYRYEEEDAEGKKRARIEVSWVVYDRGENYGKTAVDVRDDTTDFDPLKVTPGPETKYHGLGGALLVYQARREPGPLITPAEIGMQRGINFINYLIGLANKGAGYQQKVAINAELPTEDVAQSDGSTIKQKVAPEFGPFSMPKFVSTTYEDEQGKTVPLPAQLIFAQPVDPSGLLKSKAEWVRDFLQAVNQLHVLISGDATASAVSRAQAMVDYYLSLLDTKVEVEAALRWLLKGAVLWACALTGELDRLKRFEDAYRVRADCNLSRPALAPDERRALVELYEKRIISLENLLVLMGIEDTGGELQKLQAEAGKSDASRKMIADTALKLKQSGAGLGQSLLFAGAPQLIAAAAAATDAFPGVRP